MSTATDNLPPAVNSPASAQSSGSRAEKPALLPCPFCGGTRPELRTIYPDYKKRIADTFRVVCGDCGAGASQHCDRQWAKDRWNRRAPKPENNEAVQPKERQ